ncbi:MAG: queuosine salvage family protein [Desulfatiglandales bacterium]|nr:queuosine salvage family protein [Desulfatiglandales bacterium]
MFEVLESAKRIAERGNRVKIDLQSLIGLTQDWLSDRIRVPAWDSRYHFVGGGKETVSYLLVLDSLNFCFWPACGKALWKIQYGSETLSGYFALAVALKRAMESGVPITRTNYLAGLSSKALKEMFGGRGDLQLMERRLEILMELGRVLQRDYGGEACGLVEAAEGSAVKLVRLLATKLKSFRDVAEYRGQKVFFTSGHKSLPQTSMEPSWGKTGGLLRTWVN